jgi:hypothetical protein
VTGKVKESRINLFDVTFDGNGKEKRSFRAGKVAATTSGCSKET